MTKTWGVCLVRRVGFKVGVGSRVYFGVDDWLGVAPLSQSFPRLSRVVVNKLHSVKIVI